MGKFYSELYKKGRVFNVAELAKDTRNTLLYTGDPSLNWCIGGGWARGRLNLIYGPSRSGKSFIAVKGAAKAQATSPGDVLIFDSEYYYDDPNVARRLMAAGLQAENTHIISSNRLSGLFGKLHLLEADLAKGGIKISAMIIDSLGGIQSDLAENELLDGKPEDAGNVGRGNAKYINPILGLLLRLAAEHDITIFIVQHCIANQEQYGPKYKLIGGNRLQLLSHTILFVESSLAQDALLVGNEQRSKVEVAIEDARTMELIGKKILARCEKTRNTTENKSTEFFINFKDVRFARSEESLFNLAKNLGVLYHPLNEGGKESLNYWEFKASDSSPAAKFNGMPKTIEALKDKDLFLKVFDACKSSTKMSATTETLAESLMADEDGKGK